MGAPTVSRSMGQRLVPGDADVVAVAAEGLLGFSRQCEAVAAGLAGVDSADWLGAAGDAFRARLGREPARWRAAADAFHTAGRTLRGFASILADAQDRAAAALELYQQGQQLTVLARAEYEAKKTLARATLGPAGVVAANLAPFHDPGEPLRAQAIAQAAIAQADVTAAAAQVEQALTDAALMAPERAGATAPVSLAGPAGRVLANGPDGTLVTNHPVTITTSWDGHGGVEFGPGYTVPAGTMIPTAGISDRQTDAEHAIVASGEAPPIWQTNIEDAEYVRYHDIAAEIGLPVAVVAEVVKDTVDDVKNAVTNPSFGNIAMAAADFNAVGKVTQAARVVHAIKDAEHALDDTEHAIKDTRVARNTADAVETVGAGDKVLWTTWQSYPKVTVNGREYAQIGDRLYTKHAVDRMQPSGLGAPAGAIGAGRSVSPTYVDDVLSRTRGVPAVGPEGDARMSYTSGSVQVITEDGIIVTIITR